MKITYQGSKWQILLDPKDDFNPKLLMGWRQRKGSNLIIADDNAVNRIVLGQPIRQGIGDLCSQDVLEKYPDLYDYQAEDVATMVNYGCKLNANKMGYGKTVEAIVATDFLKAKYVLVIAPKPVCLQWVAQYEKWRPGVSVGYNDLKKDIVVLNYEKLLNAQTMTKLKSKLWDVLIVDEAHYIKNSSSKRTQNALDLPAKCRFALTGTPILKQPDDLWSVLKFVHPLYSGSRYWDFTFHFCNMFRGDHGWENRGLTDDPARLSLLWKVLDYAAIRHEDLHLTQGKRITTVKVEMNKDQKKLHKQIAQLLVDELPENCSVLNGLSKTLRLQQVTSWPGLFIDDCPGAKFEWIVETCKNNPDEKIVVFTKFEQTASALCQYLRSKDVYSVLYTGRQSISERQLNKCTFLENRCTQAIIGTIGAMGTGVDGLQKASHIAVMVDRDWLPDINTQCEDRLNRMGQKDLVQVYYLECAHSYDTHIRDINKIRIEDIRTALQDG